MHTIKEIQKKSCSTVTSSPGMLRGTLKRRNQRCSTQTELELMLQNKLNGSQLNQNNTVKKKTTQ